jgi:hypothetical protein
MPKKVLIFDEKGTREESIKAPDFIVMAVDTKTLIMNTSYIGDLTFSDALFGMTLAREQIIRKMKATEKAKGLTDLTIEDIDMRIKEAYEQFDNSKKPDTTNVKIESVLKFQR